MRRKMRLPLLLILPMILAACSAVTALNDASEPLEVYELRTPALQPAAARRGVEIVVEEPSASGALSVERIMIRPSPLQAQYLPGVRWSDTAPVMLQTLMVRGLLESGGFGSVGRRPVGSLGDYAILTELTDFQAETAEGQSGALIRVRLILRIVRERDASVVATRTFSETEVAETTDVSSIAPAFDRATTRLLSDAIPWIVARAR